MCIVNEFQRYRLQPLRNVVGLDKTFDKVVACMRSSGLKWWIAFGTALGLVRDDDFVADDSDIDFGITAVKDTPELRIPGMTLFRTTHTKTDKLVTQLAFLDDNDCIIDVYYHYEDIVPGKLYTRSQGGLICTPYYEIKELDTKYGPLPFLHPVEDYLSHRYGNWKTKMPGQKGSYSLDEVLR